MHYAGQLVLLTKGDISGNISSMFLNRLSLMAVVSSGGAGFLAGDPASSESEDSTLMRLYTIGPFDEVGAGMRIWFSVSYD